METHPRKTVKTEADQNQIRSVDQTEVRVSPKEKQDDLQNCNPRTQSKSSILIHTNPQFIWTLPSSSPATNQAYL